MPLPSHRIVLRRPVRRVKAESDGSPGESAPPSALVRGNAQSRPHLAPSPRDLRAQAVQRLQVGLGGLAAMLLLLAFADAIMQHARLAEAAAGAAGGHVASTASPSDPLADIGVAPAPEPTPGRRANRPK